MAAAAAKRLSTSVLPVALDAAASVAVAEPPAGGTPLVATVVRGPADVLEHDAVTIYAVAPEVRVAMRTGNGVEGGAVA